MSDRGVGLTERVPGVASLGRLRSRIAVRTHPQQILQVALLVVAGLYLLPLESALMVSLKTNDAFVETLPYVPPGAADLTVTGWKAAWETLNSGLVNSFIYTVPATVFSVFLGSLAAYGLTKTRWHGQTFVYVVFAIGIFIPYQSVLIPLSRLWTIVNLEVLLANLGPLNVWQLPLVEPHYRDLIELTITHTAYGIPITTLLFREFYKSISWEMIEAAKLDGATITTIYWRIILPQSKPIIAVTLIYQFTQIWNDLIMALVLVSGPDAAPATVRLTELTGGMLTSFNSQMAGAFLVALPTLAIYVLFSNQFSKGLAGAT